MNTYLISNFTRPEAGQVTAKGEDERDAVLKLLRLTGDNRGICEVVQKGHGDWHVLIQNGWTMVVSQIG